MPLELQEVDALVFQGGGVKGIAYVGSLQKMKVDGFELQKIKHFAGTSAGSQIAALLACGYTEDELRDILYTLNMRKFKDGSFGFLQNTWRLFTKFGYYKGNFIQNFVDDLIQKKLRKKKATFMDLFNARGVTLRITGTCLSTGTLDYFDKDLTPNMPICRAVHISSCIPVFYAAVKHENKYYVDGGVLRNLPVMAFPKNKTLFLEFKETKSDAKDKYEISNIFYFVLTLITICVDQSNKLFVEKGKTELSDKVRTITIDTGDVSGTDFKMTDETKMFLINQGWNAV